MKAANAVPLAFFLGVGYALILVDEVNTWWQAAIATTIAAVLLYVLTRIVDVLAAETTFVATLETDAGEEAT